MAAGFAVVTALGVGELKRVSDPRAKATLNPTLGAGGRVDDLTGSIGPSADHLPLSDEQRGHIFDGIMKLRNAPVASVPRGATALPQAVPLQDLPANVSHDVPMVEGYKFVKLDDRILLVRPADRTVVAVMPRYKTVLD
jgi:hypothetical protein